jgi:hypothetical protein
MSDDWAISSEKSLSHLRKTIISDEGEKNGNLIMAIHSSLIVYLSRPSIKELLK